MKKYLSVLIFAILCSIIAMGAGIFSGSSVSGGSGSGDMLGANNLSDVADVATSRTNLGLGTGDSPTFANVTVNGSVQMGRIFGFATATTTITNNLQPILITGRVTSVTTANDITISANPNIQAGQPGELLYISNQGLGIISFQDIGVNPSSGVHTQGNSSDLQPDAIAGFIYDNNAGHWNMVSNTGGASINASVGLVDVRAGEAITKGQAVYISGFHVGTGRLVVSKADATNSSKMPAIGLANITMANNANGQVVYNGVLSGVDTSAYSASQGLWVDGSGTLVGSKPSVDAVQRIGTVARSHASAGQIMVVGAGRSNDTPHNAAFNGTVTANEIVATGGITLGGVRNTSWPSSGGIVPTQTLHYIFPGQVFAVSTNTGIETYLNGRGGLYWNQGAASINAMAVRVSAVDTGANQPTVRLWVNGSYVAESTISANAFVVTNISASNTIQNGQYLEVGFTTAGSNDDATNVNLILYIKPKE